MKIEIELNDFWTDEENLKEAVSRAIVTSVKKQILEQYKPQIEAQIASQVREFVETKINGEFIKILDEVKDGNPITLNRKEYDSVSDYVKFQIETTSGYNTIQDHLSKMAQSHFRKMKERYDLAFASHIVSKMKESGMLNEKIVGSLLPEA